MQILTPPAPRGRVGFAIPRWREGSASCAQGLPFRSITVAGALFNAGYEILWFDQELDGDHPATIATFRSELGKAQLLFLWMNELDPMVQTASSFEIARHARSWHPTLPVAAGGEFLTICPPQFLQVESPIDFYLRGYGERSAVQLVEALQKPARALEKIPGLVWREASWRHNPVPRSQPKLLAEHMVLHHVLDLAPYIQTGGIFGNDQPTFILGTARGCAKRCTFCYWHHHPLSLLPAEEIVDLVAFLRDRYGVRQFHLAELDFLVSRRRTLKMAGLWAQRLPECRWFALVSPADLMRLEGQDWDLLAAGGCAKLELGTESGSPAILALLGKKHAPLDPYHLNQLMLPRGIHAMHNFVFGFPGERAADRRASLRLIERLRRLDCDRITFTFRFFQPSWGTPLGAPCLAQCEGFPESLPGLLDYRPLFGSESSRTFTWLAPAAERQIKSLVYHYLPLVTSKLAVRPAPRRWLFCGLRALARARLRTGCFRLGLDRKIYDRFLALDLDNTFTP